MGKQTEPQALGRKITKEKKSSVPPSPFSKALFLEAVIVLLEFINRSGPLRWNPFTSRAHLVTLKEIRVCKSTCLITAIAPRHKSRIARHYHGDIVDPRFIIHSAIR